MNMNDSPFCDLITLDSIHYECRVCGTQLTIADNNGSPPVFPCKKSLARDNLDPISFTQKIKNFAEATATHIREGMPICTETQIINRHNICLLCEFFKDDTCQKCGCPIIRNKLFASKLAWADQECPVGKWKKEI